jgi:hypothetical protein
VVVALGVVAYFAYTYLRFGIGEKLKPINRSEIERTRFIERMKYNQPGDFGWVLRGSKLIGSIQSYREFELRMKSQSRKTKSPQDLEFAAPAVPAAGQPATVKVVQMVVRPPLIGFIKIANPLARLICLQLNDSELIKDAGAHEIVIPPHITLDYLFGIYYDASLEEQHTDFIKQDNLFRSDMNEIASIYFAKSQEQSTFDPVRAHELALKEKELQIEMAKKTGKTTSI